MTEIAKVAFLRTLNCPLEISEAIFPAPQAHQVLVRIEATGVCGSQISEISGNKNNAEFLPHLLGHEGVGRVIAIGQDVTKVQPGNRVVIHWRKSWGGESGGVKLRSTSGEQINGGPCTTFSEMSMISENRLTPISERASSTIATLLGCGLSTAMSLVEREIDVREKSRVLILGAGGVGIGILAALRIRGLEDIWVVDKSAEKRDLIFALGAARFFNNVEAIAEDLGDKLGLFDYIFEVTGNPKIRMGAAKFLAKKGVLVIIGQAGPEEYVNIGQEKHLFGSEGTTVVFSQGGSFDPEVDIPRYLELLDSHKSITNLLADTHFGGIHEINNLIDTTISGTRPRQVLVLN